MCARSSCSLQAMLLSCRLEARQVLAGDPQLHDDTVISDLQVVHVHSMAVLTCRCVFTHQQCGTVPTAVHPEHLLKLTLQEDAETCFSRP